MKKIVTSLFLLTFFISCTVDRVIPTLDITVDSSSVLIHYWNFNATSGTLSSVAPDFTLLPTSNPQITYDGTGAGYMDSAAPGYSINARNNDDAGNLIKVRNPSDSRSLNFDLPTTGYQKIVLKFATSKSNSGATQQNYSYTIDGTNYVSNGLNFTSYYPNTDPSVDIVAIDFRTIPGVDNNPNFKFKITFSGDAATGTSGNNRFDNITLEGLPAAPSNLAYTASNNFTINTAITPLTPSVSGLVSSYSVSPSLPSGLSINSATGVISGTPTQISTASNYTITATNSSGSATFIVSIAVSAVVDNTVYLIYYWNFSSISGTLTSIPADSTLITPNVTSITYPGTGAGYMDAVTPATTLNEQTPADANSNALRVRNPSDTRSLIITASTAGYKNIVVKFATDRTNSGATVQNYSYTIDGTNYITTGLSTTTSSPTIDPSYSLVTLDFSSIASVANNPNFKIKIDFAGPNASGATGNNRFDNITFQGNTL